MIVPDQPASWSHGQLHQAAARHAVVRSAALNHRCAGFVRVGGCEGVGPHATQEVG